MEVALLVIGVLVLLEGLAFLAWRISPLVWGRARLVKPATWWDVAQVVVGVVGLAMTVTFGVGVARGHGGTGATVQVPTSTPPSSATRTVETPTPGMVATATPGLSGPSATITTPEDGATVPVGVQINGKSSGIPAGQVPDSPGPWIYVIVRPRPGDPTQSWWVQPAPLVNADGSWDDFIFVGLETDPPGTPYDICGIVSQNPLPVGRYGGLPPAALARDCVTVKR